MSVVGAAWATLGAKERCQLPAGSGGSTLGCWAEGEELLILTSAGRSHHPGKSIQKQLKFGVGRGLAEADPVPCARQHPSRCLHPAPSRHRPSPNLLTGSRLC